MELQFYPPGFTPFTDSESCSVKQWCGALTIDSLECNYGFASCNNTCIEPVNFAFLQTNGVPAGPPGPQDVTVRSYLGNARTLKLNPGDVLRVSITDPPSGLTATVHDLTTGQAGWMTASARNGFMNTSMATCDGHPFTFHAEYDTARQQNMVPWSALEGGVLMEQEIGHFEACRRVTEPGRLHADRLRPVLPRPAGVPDLRQRLRGQAHGRGGPVQRARPASASTRRPRAPPGRSPARPGTPAAASCASSPTATASRRAAARC